MTKRTLGKALLSAGIITTGIVVAGISFTGDAGLQNIENNLNNMKTEFTQVVEDNTFLKTQYDKLAGFYDSSVTKANDTIAEITGQRDGYYQELTALRNELADRPTAESDRIEIQAEITRLEGELTKANTKIAELEATAQAIDDSTIVDRVVKAEYTAEEIEVDSIEALPMVITPEAMALNSEKAQDMLELSNNLSFTTADSNILNDLVFTSVTVLDGALAYEVEEVLSTRSIWDVRESNLTALIRKYDNDPITIFDKNGTKGTFTYSYSNQITSYDKAK